MKSILKTVLKYLEMKYDEKFGSEINTEIMRDLIPCLVKSLKRYKVIYLPHWCDCFYVIADCLNPIRHVYYTNIALGNIYEGPATNDEFWTYFLILEVLDKVLDIRKSVQNLSKTVQNLSKTIQNCPIAQHYPQANITSVSSKR